MDNPPKQCKRFLRESKAMGKVNTNISYYCKLHAALEAMQMSPQTPEIKAFLGAILMDLETNKPTEPKETTLEALENVALNAFSHADNVDRAGNADLKTVKAFTTSFVLLTVLKGQQKSEFSPENEEKIKYGIFKSTDIFKCIKQGIKPTPGPPGGMEEPEPVQEIQPQPEEPSNPWANNNDGGMGMGMSQPVAPVPADDNFGLPMIPQAEKKPVSRPSFNPTPAASQPKSTDRSHGDNFEQKVAACARAETIMKHAFGAMRFNDIPMACEKLEEALAALQPYR